ncbi:MAG: S41 family peptidase [Butyrivibrio sp.]|nr:S41 family peptidase [Butyrivibrio sp.]
MDSEQQKETYNKGVKIGIAIGGLSVLLICIITAGIFASLWFQKKTVDRRQNPTLNLDVDVTDKMNTLLDYMDDSFLYEYDKAALSEKIYAAMLDSLDDPYSCYYTAEEYRRMMESTNGTFYGMGAVVTTNPETGDIYIVEPYDGSPAQYAGVLPGDIIRAVDGKDIEGMDSDAVVSLIHGEEGTEVTVTFQRGDERYDATMVRRAVDVKTVESRMLDGDIGYILISHFSAVTYKQFTDAYEQLESEGMKAVIFDVRANPGGRLDTVNDMLDYLLPEGLLVYTVDKKGRRDEFTSDASAKLDIPCAVIADGNSASASEVFCGALQDYDAAEIVGTQTFGKGIVQSIISLYDGSAIKITVEDYYTPNGNNIHGIGITPDIEAEYDAEAAQEGADSQLDAATEYIKSQIN